MAAGPGQGAARRLRPLPAAALGAAAARGGMRRGLRAACDGAAAEQGSGGVARRSGDGRGRRPRGEAERRPAQLGGAGARGSTVQGHADKARDGRRWQQSRQRRRRPCSGTGGAQNKGGEKAEEHE